jgi:hypothetical protein
VSELQGRRLPDDSDIREAKAGDYFRVAWTGSDNEWWFRDPRGDPGRITKHTVEEHEDGTITVTPSIAPAPGDDGWHGFLRRGVWSAA